MEFVIYYKDGHKEHYSNRYDESDEYERDAAFDDVYMIFDKDKNVDFIDEY